MIRILFLLLIPTISFAQNNTQKIRGIVTDKLSQTPLIGVVIQISSLQIGTTTDTLGKYTLSNIPPERYEIKISYIGYKSIIIPNVEVTSGKEVILDIALEESFSQLAEVVVKANNKGGTINKLASVSARTFSMEEVNRYAGRQKRPCTFGGKFCRC
jgi:hypothetical protein